MVAYQLPREEDDGGGGDDDDAPPESGRGLGLAWVSAIAVVWGREGGSYTGELFVCVRASCLAAWSMLDTAVPVLRCVLLWVAVWVVRG